MLKRYDTLDIENQLIRNFWDISHTMHCISEGKGSQKRILMVLLENRDMTQQELTGYLGIQPGSVSEVVKKLESAGLVERTPSKKDRRTSNLSLTQKGEDMAVCFHKKREQRHQEMFSCLSESEKQQLERLLKKINQSWNRQYHKKDGGKRKCGSI